MGALTFAVTAWQFVQRYWQALAVGALLAAAALWHHNEVRAAKAEGRAIERAEWVAKAEQDKQRIAAGERRMTELHRQLEISLANRKTEIRTVTKTNVEEVTKYVTLESDRRCTVPVGLVWHHDAAAAGRAVDPAPAVSLVDAPSDVALSRVESVVAENYGTAHEWRAELLDCRARYTAAWEMMERLKK